MSLSVIDAGNNSTIVAKSGAKVKDDYLTGGRLDLSEIKAIADTMSEESDSSPPQFSLFWNKSRAAGLA